MKHSVLVLVLFRLLLHVGQCQQPTSAQDSSTSSTSPSSFFFDGCEVDSYYSDMPGDVNEWTVDELQVLLKSTHRNQLVYTRANTPGIDDVWAALIDVDRGTVENTVKLIYNDPEQIDAIPFGQRTWIKEHLWPIWDLVEKLAEEEQLGPDVSDLHNLRPVDPLVDSVRGSKFFGDCGHLTPDPQSCKTPAEGAAAETCSCSDVFTPPPSVKGDIARALLYMDVRYQGNDTLTQNLRLTDCPRIPFLEMGYLSQMINWHLQDPPSDEERERNFKVCQNWQGNRNPFVDYPDLVTVLYYEPFPLPPVGERTQYEACDKLPTLPPTYAPNDCDLAVNPSDIYIWLLNSDDPDTVAMYTFRDFPEGLRELYMTDNPWNGTQFVESTPNVDGTLKLTIPEGGIQAGTPIGYGGTELEFANDWETVQGNFSLSSGGDGIFLYCINGKGEQKPLLAFSHKAVLQPDGLEYYNESSSSYPYDDLGELGLQNIVLNSANVLFNRTSVPDTVSSADLKIALRDPAYWIGSNDSRFDVESLSSAFTVHAFSSWTVILTLATTTILAAATTSTFFVC